MANFGNELRDRVGQLADSTPLVATARGIAKVGATAQDLYAQGKAKINQLIGEVGPRKRPELLKRDIKLPARRMGGRR